MLSSQHHESIGMAGMAPRDAGQSSEMSKSRKKGVSLENALTFEDVQSSNSNEDSRMSIFAGKCLSSIWRFENYLGNQLFPGLPEHYSLRKKMKVLRSVSNLWAAWDLLQVVLTLTSCCLYICYVANLTYEQTFAINIADIFITQFFLLDFLFNWYMEPNLYKYFSDWMTINDMLSLLPLYLSLFFPSNNGNGGTYVGIEFFRCLRILRLARIFKYLKYMHNMSGIRRQKIFLSLTLVVLIYLATSFIMLIENDFGSHGRICNYINADTNWEPACDINLPANVGCIQECKDHTCNAFYTWGDKKGEPSGVRCGNLSFFDAFYYIIITVSTIGYGDVKLKNKYAQAVNIVFIIASVVIIPMRLSELQALLSLTNPYSKPYYPQNNESHVIVTGYTSDKKKLENFLKEFFHPDRVEKEGEEHHAVILSSTPPSEDIRSLLLSHSLESKVTWVIGTALNINDLKKAKADTATAIFFLINTDLQESYTRVQDAENVLCALSLSNFSSTLRSFVQVLRPENGDILLDSDVDMILCLDEYKTAVQARNAICPGFGTFIENLLHSMGNVSQEIEKNMPPWYEEYLHGAGMELYFVPLPKKFIIAMRYCFRRMAEVIYLEYECIVLGVLEKESNDVVFNPSPKDLSEFASVKEFFLKFNCALVMADDQHQADAISRDLQKNETIEQLIQNAIDEEAKLAAHNGQRLPGRNKPNQMAEVPGSGDMFTSGVQSLVNVVSTTSRQTMKMAKVVVDRTEKNVVSVARALTHSISEGGEDESEEESEESSSIAGNSDDSFTEDEMDTDDDEEEEYIGFRKTGSNSNAVQYEGFGSRSGQDYLSTRSNLGENEINPYAEFDRMAQDTKDDDDSSSEEEYSSGEDKFDDDIDDMAIIARNSTVTQLLFEKDGKYGKPSQIVKDASFLSNHIIVHGCDTNIHMFVGELRRPSISGSLYHSILIIQEEIPSAWHYIEEHYNDIYFMQGKIGSGQMLKKMNLKAAFSMSLMSARTVVNKVDEQNVNVGTLFTFLKVENLLPKNVFVSVELTSSSNMAVLNATIMRRVKEKVERTIRAHRGNTLYKSATVTEHKPLTSNLSIDESPPKSDAKQKNEGKKGHNDVRDKKTRRHAALFDGEGRFTSKRKSVAIAPARTAISAMQNANQNELQKKSNAANAPTAGGIRRGSVIALKNMMNTVTSYVDTASEDLAKTLDFFDESVEELWDAMDTHHVLPVFASGRAFVPSSFESLLVQSFYVKITPVICEKFVCGQLNQSVQSVNVPKELVGRRFVDLFRIFISNNVLVLGLYRGPQPALGSILPYVYISPPKHTILGENDRIYIFAAASAWQRTLIAIRSIPHRDWY